MREKLETLSLVQLRELGKSQGLKVSGLRKAQIIDLLCEIADRGKEASEPSSPASSAAGSEASSEHQGNRAAAQRTAERPERVERTESARPMQQPYIGGRSYGYEPASDYRHDSIQESRQSYDYQRMASQPQPYGTYPQESMQTASMQSPMQQSAYMQQGQQPIQGQFGQVPQAHKVTGILEVMPDGFGFIRGDNYLPSDSDVYVAPGQIKKFGLKTGDIICGNCRLKSSSERFAALIYIESINGTPADLMPRRPSFESMTPIFPDERIRLEMSGRQYLPLRVLDLLSPIGKGQRGMIVSPPKAGKTTLLKQVAKSIIRDRDMHLIILLIDERPEEVTDIKEEVTGPNVEVIYSTFDELPERHKRVSEMTIESAKRLVEEGRDVVILLDSITRLARAYNLVVPPSGRTLSGGLDPNALHMPKRFFGAARNMREGGSLTILATALIDTGSRMDDVIYEEFKGTGNMEVVLDRKLSEKRIFPAIDILKSGTRRDDLLLSEEEQKAVTNIRRAFSSLKPEEAVEKVLDLFDRTKDNAEFIRFADKIHF